MDLEYSELVVLMKRLLPMEKDLTEIPKTFSEKRDVWEQEKLNSAIRKLEAEATRLRNKERDEEYPNSGE